MAKKYISGENLVYALGVFENQMRDMVEKITDIIIATEPEIYELFEQNSTSIEESKVEEVKEENN